jgi:hypothetical protein
MIGKVKKMGKDKNKTPPKIKCHFVTHPIYKIVQVQYYQAVVRMKASLDSHSVSGSII